ncbi:MAG TPA: hypothetical protein VEQ61_05595 [Thermoleophilaceae bacterium]|nr:hypothetical protein [Thermoleophilaceae bacterium]
MTLRVADPTRESVEVVQQNLSELAGRSAFRGRALGRVNPLNVALAAPHDVYSLGLEELAEGASIDSAQPVGRRFMVMDGDRPVASAEVAGRQDGSGFQANEGPFVAATARAIEQAEEDPELADGDYELRVLRIPALYLMALWLKDENGDGDLVIPLDPAPTPLESGRRYRPEEVLAELQTVARERLSFDDARNGGLSAP